MAFAPAVWMAISATTAAAGAAVSSYGLIQQGKAQRREADYNAAVQENNAVSAGYAAIQEGQAAQREVGQLQEARIRNLSSQRVSAAHSGLTISGSVLDTMGDSALSVEKEIQMTLYRGRMSAFNTGQQAANLRTQANFTRSAGRTAQRNSLYGAGGTLLSSAASIGSSYAAFKKG